ncbi:MAG TPA: hypothetical protein VGX21_14125 [Methylomirabilota bacterium]|jgi:hypothetical protein|nr:hypothetical protein [Methylomirabilota bacterium]
MEPHRGGRGALKVGLLAAGLLLALGPVAADAECTGNSIVGVLTETIERVDFVATDEPSDPVHRVATAKEVGTLTQGCGSLAFLEGAVKVQPVISDVSLATGVGPITGSVKFYPSSSGGGVLKGTLAGTLDFTPAFSGLPFVNVSGTWIIPSLGVSGNFAGVALLAFPCAAPTGFCYIDLDNPGEVVPLTIPETQPAPLSKFVVTLFN